MLLLLISPAAAMELFSFPWRIVAAALLAALVSLALPVYGQPATSCTPAMLTAFTPCMKFLNRNVTAPTPDCCTSIKTIAADGSDCLCQLATGRSPFQFRINPILSLSFLQACNMPTISRPCHAAPIPAPGPGAFAPLFSTTEAESPAPVISPSEPDAPSVLTPTSSTRATGSPASSASLLASRSSPADLLLILIRVSVMLYH